MTWSWGVKYEHLGHWEAVASKLSLLSERVLFFSCLTYRPREPFGDWALGIGIAVSKTDPCPLGGTFCFMFLWEVGGDEAS